MNDREKIIKTLNQYITELSVGIVNAIIDLVFLISYGIAKMFLKQ